MFFSIFNVIFLIAIFPTTRSNPITIDTASIPNTAGAATIVERRLTPVIPNQIAVTCKQLSITPIILTPLLYFILSSFHLSLQRLQSNPRRLLMDLSFLKSTSYLFLRNISDFKVLVLANISMLSLSFALDIFSHFSLNKLIDIFIVITILGNNKVKP